MLNGSEMFRNLKLTVNYVPCAHLTTLIPSSSFKEAPKKPKRKHPHHVELLNSHFLLSLRRML